MYLLINGEKHTCSGRKEISGGGVKFLTVTPKPENISGMIQMCRDDDFVLCEDDADKYSRKLYKGTAMTLTNLPDPQPKDPRTDPNYRISMLEVQAADTDEIIVDQEYRLTLLELGITE